MKSEKEIKTDLLLKNKEFRCFQPDFARAILTEPAYTKTAALKILRKRLKSREGE